VVHRFCKERGCTELIVESFLDGKEGDTNLRFALFEYSPRLGVSFTNPMYVI